MADKKRPVLIEIDDEDTGLTPDLAPEVPEPHPPVEGRAMQNVIALGARKRSLLGRLFWWVTGALLALVVSVWAWDFVTGLIGRNSYLGYAATGLFAVMALVLLAIALREWAGFARLKRLDGLRAGAEAALAANDLGAAQTVAGRLLRLYRDREDLQWQRDRFTERNHDMFDADALFQLAEAELLAPIDAAAAKEIEAAARQVATVTAIVPIALADLLTALTANLRMIRRIAELYGGRAGTLGNWRLARAVMAHLVATGAVAVGDDLLGSVAGGGVLSKLSRRFGEGIINGALTARVGVAAMEVCRPLPFHSAKRPSVTGLVQRALTGLFGKRG